MVLQRLAKVQQERKAKLDAGLSNKALKVGVLVLLHTGLCKQLLLWDGIFALTALPQSLHVDASAADAVQPPTTNLKPFH
jgi:hypothetical protein